MEFLLSFLLDWAMARCSVDPLGLIIFFLKVQRAQVGLVIFEKGKKDYDMLDVHGSHSLIMYTSTYWTNKESKNKIYCVLFLLLFYTFTD